MKKYINLLLAVLLPAFVGAYNVQIDGIYYILYKKYKTVEVTCKEQYDRNAFYSNYSGNVVIPNEVFYEGDLYTVTAIGDGAFYKCGSLQSVSIPNSVTKIGDHAFRGCIGLEAISIPDSVTTIGDYTFCECQSLKTVSIPTSVTTIGEGAFSDCINLVSVCVSNRLTAIPSGLFAFCSSLTSFTIPNSVTDIGLEAFYKTSGLKTITCEREYPPAASSGAFSSEILENATLFVPNLAINNYKSVTPWKGFKEIRAISAKPRLYTLTYLVDGEVYMTTNYNEGDNITPEAEPTKEGYSFSGWGWIPSKMPGEDVVVSGTFNVKKYKLIYLLDGEEYKTKEMEYGSDIIPEANPTKEGYVFSGWSYIPSTMPAEDVMVTGILTINTYKLIFMVDGEVYKTIDVVYGDRLPEEEGPTKEGYSFSGWSWMPNKMPAEDVIVSGVFAKENYEVMGNCYQIEDGQAVLVKGENVSDVAINSVVVINNNQYYVTTIGQRAFEGCNNVNSVTIYDGMESILANAFNGCINLNKLTLGKDVQFIGTKAFANIAQSKDAGVRGEDNTLVVECYAESVPYSCDDSFDGTPVENATLRVNDNLVDIYKNAYPWSGFGDIIGFNETVVINTFHLAKEAEIFSIDGQKLDKLQKGINIMRTSQGIRMVVVN